jgi:hypothetical protein
MQPNHTTYALPYCPRPNREEAPHSWLTRVAQGYGLTADRLLDHLLRVRDATFCLERAFVAPHVNVLSKATRIPRRALSRLQGAPIDWILQDRRYCNVCIHCIDSEPGTRMGPVANRIQFERVQWYINKGIEENARLVAGGPGRPRGLERGYFVQPTVFADVTNAMTIAREEIFGPVLVLIPYKSEDDAIRIANDSVYGLSGHVHSGNLERARRVARRLRTGMVHLNGAARDFRAPFGGYKRSGNGREWGREAFNDYLESKSMMGYE